MAAKLWILKATATAGPGSGYRHGLRYPILVFVSGDDAERCAAGVPPLLAAQGWTDHVATRADLADLERITDPGVRPAALRGAEGGCGIVVFNTPLPGAPAAPAVPAPVKWN